MQQLIGHYRKNNSVRYLTLEMFSLTRFIYGSRSYACRIRNRGPSLSYDRFNSTDAHSEHQIKTAKEWLATFQARDIPRHTFQISYSRSSGPGGQKVNKTSSKATISLDPSLWLDARLCFWIPVAVQHQLRTSKVRYETKGGGILVQSDLSRNRDVNTDLCFSKLLDEIKNKSRFDGEASEEVKQKWDDHRLVVKEHRLHNKKVHSDKKKSRTQKFSL